jgi:hypothetical protein
LEVRSQRYREFGGSLNTAAGKNPPEGSSSRCGSSSQGAAKSGSSSSPSAEPNQTRLRRRCG